MRHKLWIVGLLASLGLALAGCGGRPLVTNGSQPGLPTAPADANLSGPDTFTPASPDGAAGGGEVIEASTAPESSPLAAVPSTDLAASNEPVPSSDPAAVPSNAPPVVEATPEPTVAPFAEQITLPSAQDRWRYVQVDRNVLPAIQNYRTDGTEILWWYDPIFGRTIKLGEIQGSFPVQAAFRFRGQEVDALEVPYQINQSFGITLPQATIDEMREAGITDWAETFVYVDADVRPE